MRNILLLQQHSPFNNSNGREALDMALALAAVEHSVSILFCDDAVYQLLPTVDQPDFGLKQYPRSFKLFSLYDIEQVYACLESVTARGLEPAQLNIAVTLLSKADIAALLSSQHQVITT
ncbi:sulfurtransferase complex subunit TusC [Rheinheimera aquimaris]|uniref:Sulfurtransferase complex subunit TusC n=1 Tax=Rheinheimera aquimaris TaxID=412437 RepID=A0ABN1DGJ2_9GAMM|nr:sulfurtransferase complex subunit TusC [Rheinheimera aquimaris]MCB5211994.1 sulfurtransferase complex subunit TusC [Rheinheimera aquimaris]